LKVNGYLLVEDISPAAIQIWQLVSAALLPDQYESHVVAGDGILLFVVRRLR
jgi:hypothetical protein